MTFLHIVGPEALAVYNSFTWTEDDDKKKLDKIIDKFKNYYNPKKRKKHYNGKMTIGKFQNTSKANILSLTVATVDMSIKKANVLTMESSAENVEKKSLCTSLSEHNKDMFIILEMIVCRMKIMTTNMNGQVTITCMLE